MNQTSDPARIAGELSERERLFLVEPEKLDEEAVTITAIYLSGKGIVTNVDISWCFIPRRWMDTTISLTPLGVAVREEIKKGRV